MSGNKKSTYVLYWVLDILLSLAAMYVMGPAPGIKTFLAEREKSHIGVYMAIVFVIVTAVMFLLRRYVYNWLENLQIKQACMEFGARFHINKKELLVLALFVMAGAYLRFSGLDWGIDHIFQPDEKKLVRYALGMAAELNPYNIYVGYPNQFVSKFAALCMLVYSKLFDVKLRGNTIVCYFIFRGCVAFLSTMIIPLSYCVGNYFRKGMGLVFAGFVTVFPPFVNYAKQVTGDINVLFFSILVLLCSFYYLEKQRKRDICAMTLFAAMVTMEKWHGGIICLYIAAVIIFCCKTDWKRLLRESTLAFVSWLFWIFVIAPNIIWDIRNTIDEVIFIFISEGSVYMPDDMAVFYINCFFSYGGIITAVLVILGLFHVFRRRERKYLVLLLGLMNWLIMCNVMNRNFERWGMASYYTLLILLSLGICLLLYDGKRAITIAGGAMAAIVLVTFAVGSMRYVYLATHSIQDTRIIGEQVLWELGIKQNNSIYEYYTPFSPGGIRAVEEGEGQKSKTMNEYLISENGQVYVTEPDVLYAVTSSYRNWGNGHAMLDENAQLLVSLDAEVHDLFHADIGLGSWQVPEFVTCYRNFQEISKVRAGANLGPEIRIYDISMLPVKASDS